MRRSAVLAVGAVVIAWLLFHGLASVMPHSSPSSKIHAAVNQTEAPTMLTDSELASIVNEVRDEPMRDPGVRDEWGSKTGIGRKEGMAWRRDAQAPMDESELISRCAPLVRASANKLARKKGTKEYAVKLATAIAAHKAEFATELATEVAAHKASLEDEFARYKAGYKAALDKAWKKEIKARKEAIETELEARNKTMALVALGAIALCVSVGAVGLAGTLVLAALLACLVEYDFVAGCVRTAADYAAPLGAAAVRMIAAAMAS